jgi:hypothetical protein
MVPFQPLFKNTNGSRTFRKASFKPLFCRSSEIPPRKPLEERDWGRRSNVSSLHHFTLYNPAEQWISSKDDVTVILLLCVSFMMRSKREATSTKFRQPPPPQKKGKFKANIFGGQVRRSANKNSADLRTQ